VLAIDPRFWYAHITIATCLSAQGRYAEAIQEFHLVPEEDSEYASPFLGNVLALAGRRDEAMVLLRKELSSDPGSDGGNRWVHASFIQAGLNDKAGALTSLENSYAQHETDVNYIGVEPMLDPLRKEARFQALLKKLGL